MGFQPHIGGAERQAKIQAETQTKLGHKVDVFTQRMPKTKHFEKINDVYIYRFGWSEIIASKEITSFLISVRLLFCIKNYDIIQVHQGHFLALLVSIICYFLKKPCFIKIANSGRKFDLNILQDRYKFKKLIYKLILKSKPKFVAISPTVKNELINYGVDKNTIHSIPNGVENYHQTFDSISQLIQGSKINKAVFIGRFEKIKNPLFFLEIARQSNKKIEFHLYGSGTQKNQLINFKNKNSLDNCFIHEPTQDISNVLNESNVLVLPSITEGMSNAILEALAHGVPIIGSDIPPNKFLISSNEEESSGLLISSKDPKIWSNALHELLENKSKYIVYSKNAYNQSIEYDINFVVGKYIEMYLKYL